MKPFIRNGLLASAAAFATLPALAQDFLTPTAAKGAQVISVEDARDLLGKARMFDMRSPISYGRGHIKGAVAMQYTQRSEKLESFDASKDTFDMSKLPKDKSLPIVFYSDGRAGWKSYKAAVLAARAGYSNVKWMRAGVTGWTAKGLALE
jgi:rhodanese-related sulfurtransferase